jgi:hypothetical protein
LGAYYPERSKRSDEYFETKPVHSSDHLPRHAHKYLDPCDCRLQGVRTGTIKSQMTAAREKHNKKPHRSSNRRNRAGGCTGTTLTLHILKMNGGEP